MKKRNRVDEIKTTRKFLIHDSSQYLNIKEQNNYIHYFKSYRLSFTDTDIS